jgi:hypothetical protein
VSVVVCSEASVGVCVVPGIVIVGDLQRHERSPMRTGTNFAYRSVFEKGLETEVLEPEATATEDEAAPLVGVGTVGGFARAGDGAEDFTEAVTRFIAARPLALIWRA